VYERPCTTTRRCPGRDQTGKNEVAQRLILGFRCYIFHVRGHGTSVHSRVSHVRELRPPPGLVRIYVSCMLHAAPCACASASSVRELPPPAGCAHLSVRRIICVARVSRAVHVWCMCAVCFIVCAFRRVSSVYRCTPCVVTYGVHHRRYTYRAHVYRLCCTPCLAPFGVASLHGHRAKLNAAGSCSGSALDVSGRGQMHRKLHQIRNHACIHPIFHPLRDAHAVCERALACSRNSRRTSGPPKVL
jgi:hypothetical protein